MPNTFRRPTHFTNLRKFIFDQTHIKQILGTVQKILQGVEAFRFSQALSELPLRNIRQFSMFPSGGGGDALHMYCQIPMLRPQGYGIWHFCPF